MEYLNLSLPFANLSLSPPDVIMFIPARKILYAAKKIARRTKNPIPTVTILFNISDPPVGTPVGKLVGSMGEIPGIFKESSIILIKN